VKVTFKSERPDVIIQMTYDEAESLRNLVGYAPLQSERSIPTREMMQTLYRALNEASI
jgi:hypothetical protein